MKIPSRWPWPQGHPQGGDGAVKNFRPISIDMQNMNEIHQRVFKIWGLINFNAKTLTLTFFMKILSPWPWPQGHPRGGDGADKNFRPISIIMPNMNEIHQRVFKIWGLINFNAKTLTLTFSWRSPRGGDGADKNFGPISIKHAKYEWNPSKGLQNMRSYKL